MNDYCAKHNLVLPVGTMCGGCEQDDADRSCPKCGVGTDLRLGSAYECENPDCIEDHEGALVWEIENGEKVMLEPLKFPYVLRHYLEGV